ncbi:MAG: DUF3093 domain-containing protein [Actinomycetota bacterium]|nr:DUF3093 domain-containing protein [Actinomycetota bacterium]
MPAHDERMRVPLWWWPPALVLAALAAAEVHQGASGWRSWVPYAVAGPLAAGWLWWAGRVRVWVDRTELHVDDAHLPLSQIAAAEPLAGDAKRLALGPHLDPLAFVVQRPWIGTAVKVTLADPADPTPYWIVSSRRAAQLAAAVRPAAGGPATGPTTTARTQPS